MVPGQRLQCLMLTWLLTLFDIPLLLGQVLNLSVDTNILLLLALLTHVAVMLVFATAFYWFVYVDDIYQVQTQHCLMCIRKM